jgi:hypothetical protein
MVATVPQLPHLLHSRLHARPAHRARRATLHSSSFLLTARPSNDPYVDSRLDSWPYARIRRGGMLYALFVT